jgi:hypothetical protein
VSQIGGACDQITKPLRTDHHHLQCVRSAAFYVRRYILSNLMHDKGRYHSLSLVYGVLRNNPVKAAIPAGSRTQPMTRRIVAAAENGIDVESSRWPNRKFICRFEGVHS